MRNLRTYVPFVVGFGLSLVLAVGGLRQSWATKVPGGGPKKSDCYLNWDVDVSSSATIKGTSVKCTEGDFGCDQDACGNNSCQFKVRVCLNQQGESPCTPPTGGLTKVTFKPSDAIPSADVPALNTSACGAFVTIDVPLKGKKKNKPGKKVIHGVAVSSAKPKKDADALVLICQPRKDACLPTTTTTSSTSTTIGGGCGVTTTTTSTTTTTIACANKCAGENFLSFTTALATGNCGILADKCGVPLTTKRCSGSETACTQASDCSPGHFCSDGNLLCGGLYFGGGGVGVPLPATIPDLGNSLTKITSCDNATGNMVLAATTSTDTGSNLNCTSAGCFFGAPLPIPNPTTPASSTCVINVVHADAVGLGNICAGTAGINLPLDSEIFLTGDLLNGTGGAPDVPGLQPCPLCTAGHCQGGPNDGMTCTPGDTAPPGSTAYPTSHDCPPPSGTDLGALPIGFALTSGTSTKTGTDLGTLNGRKNLICGFCSNNVTGSPAGPPAVPCTSDADCTTPPFTVCQQRDSGAFGFPSVRSITEVGAAAGDLSDNASHPATLVSVFCIPPTYNALVDGAGDLAGPGAVALKGTTQLKATP